MVSIRRLDYDQMGRYIVTMDQEMARRDAVSARGKAKYQAMSTAQKKRRRSDQIKRTMERHLKKGALAKAYQCSKPAPFIDLDDPYWRGIWESKMIGTDAEYNQCAID